MQLGEYRQGKYVPLLFTHSLTDQLSLAPKLFVRGLSHLCMRWDQPTPGHVVPHGIRQLGHQSFSHRIWLLLGESQ